jgi:beta-glucosidase
MNAGYLTVMLESQYTDACLKAGGKDASKVTSDDLTIIGTPVDFVGINVYRPSIYVLASDKSPGMARARLTRHRNVLVLACTWP